MAILVGLLAVAVALLAVIVFGLLRTHAEILRALAGLGVQLDEDSNVESRSVAQPTSVSSVTTPSMAHDIVGVTPSGSSTKVGVAGTGHTTLLAFISSGCRTCKPFWDAFADPSLSLPGSGTRLVLVGQDRIHESDSTFDALVPGGIKAVMSTAAWQTTKYQGHPISYLFRVRPIGSSDREPRRPGSKSITCLLRR